MRIVHILNHMPDTGNGIACATVDLAYEQAKFGHEVYVISGGGGFVPLLEEHGIRHLLVKQDRRPATILKALYEINRVLLEIRPHIVHGQMVTGVVLARVLKIFHSFRLISTVHNEFDRAAILMGLADRVIAVSAAVSQCMIEKGVSAEKMHVVRNGTIGSIRANRHKDTGVVLQRPSVTTVAGMFSRKGIDCLIRAFAILKEELPDAHLYLVGDGADKKKFEQIALETSFSDYIHFEGFKLNPREYLQQTDVFVLASHSEPFGLVLSEARAEGCAVIGSNVGGIPEVLEQGRAGQLFMAGDTQTLALLLRATLQNSDKLLYWKEQAVKNLSWLATKRMAAETMAVYQS